MKKRVQLSDGIRAREHHWVTQFFLNHVVPDPGARGITTEVIFEAYQKFLSDEGLSKTMLNVDGFGRMLPRSLYRKPLTNEKGQMRKTAVGMKLA